jgi:serine/threonine protein kinase
MPTRINNAAIDAYMQGIYVCDNNMHIAPSTMGLTIKVKSTDNDTIYNARIFKGMCTYGIRGDHANDYATGVRREIDIMINSNIITNGMGPKVISTFPQNLDQIDSNISGICCIVVFEDITSIPPMGTLGDKDTKLKILYNVGSAISALHLADISYSTFNAFSICLQDNAIRLMNIGKNFAFEVSIGIHQRRVINTNDSYIAPELIHNYHEMQAHSEQKIDAYAFGIYLFETIFQEYGIFPASDSNRRAYGTRNPIQSEVLEDHKMRQLAIWDSLPQDLKNLFGGLPNTYPEHLTRGFSRIGGFISGTEQFTDQPIRGLLCQNPAMRLTISKSLDNEWFMRYATAHLEESEEYATAHLEEYATAHLEESELSEEYATTHLEESEEYA